MANRPIVVVATGGEWERPLPTVKDVNEFTGMLYQRRFVEYLGHVLFRNRFHDVEEGVQESWMKFRDYSVAGRVRFMRGYTREHLHDDVRHAQAHSYVICCFKSYMYQGLRRHSHTKRVGGVEFEQQFDHHEDPPFFCAEVGELFEHVRCRVITEQWDVWTEHLEGKSFAEIAEEWKIPLNRVRNYVVHTMALIEIEVSRFIDDGLAAI